MKRLIVIALATLSAAATALLLQCDDNGTGGQDTFQVHEWGVVIATQGDSNAVVTSRPEQASPVREPVIYVSGRKSGPMSFKASFHSGWPTESYPPALVGKSTVEWDTVFQLLPILAPASSVWPLVPFDSIKELLGNVDGPYLNYRDTLSPFLFYEGVLVYRNQVSVTWDLDSLMAHLTNGGSFPVYNLTVSIAGPTSGQVPVPITYRARVSRLNPGVTADLLLSQAIEYSFTNDLMSLGFTAREATAFDTLWRVDMLNPFDQGAQVNLAYRLPQSEYDSLISLEVTPVPDRTIRALYALVHFPPQLATAAK